MEYYVDTTLILIKNKAVATGVRFLNDSMSLIVKQPEFSDLQIRYNNQWINLPMNTSNLTLTPEFDSIIVINPDLSIIGLNEGSSKLFLSYLDFRDTLLINVSAGLFGNAIIRSVSSGRFSSSTTWNRNSLPTILDSVIIQTGHTVIIDTTIRIRALYLAPGAILKIQTNDKKDSLIIGEIKANGLTGLLRIMNINMATKALTGHFKGSKDDTLKFAEYQYRQASYYMKKLIKELHQHGIGRFIVELGGRKQKAKLKEMVLS